ncbi:5'-methylthioadenosine/S-adenosylhomocysteine nucleosidase family protein [Mycobacteroides abscessus]|uniref:5'-methylthioadenosine/S-adenosylhomocysteine nucleosidase family protein n=2 Tax=Mycobacteroides abscessus TaxID=36809 RepID=UPI002E23426C
MMKSQIRPDLVAAIGVGFGLIDGDDIGGTVLIATHMREYERVRVGTNKDGGLNLRERGEYRKVDPIELQRLRMVARRSGVKYEVGEIVSGEKLVDWDPLRKLLKKRFPDAVGGDMELAGIVAACSRKHVTWLFLKAISDKGDGSKKTGSS